VGRVKTSLEPEPQRAEKTYQRKNGEKVTVDTTKLATNKPRLETAPEIEEPEVDEREQKISELVDTINELVVENQKLKDAIAVGQWDASDIEKIDVQDTIADLREQIKNLEIDNKALRDSRDMFQNRNAELLGTVKKLQSKLNKIEAVGA
jgi:FtsZ-binding cell division protein ZapB